MKRFRVGDDFGPFLRKNGCVVLSDLFRPEELVEARVGICSVFEEGFRDLNEAGLEGDELLRHYYDREKDRWRKCARRMWDVVEVGRLAALPQVLDLLRAAGLRKPLVSTRPLVRTDLPRDDAYRQPWHQDWRSGQGSVNSVTIWVPLHRVTADQGTIEVIPGSHLLGLLKVRKLTDPVRLVVDDTRVDDLPKETVELDLGECALFSQMLVHQSGVNAGDSVRFTVQLRYDDMAEPGYAAQGFPHAVTGEDLIWKSPCPEDMRAIYG